MSIFDVLTLLCGLALFLYGMDVMGKALKKSAGKKLKVILNHLTSSPLKGFLFGLGVTAVIQSSSAMTVMVVGFVNSGTMLLSQAVGVIMGANVGTAVTAWLTGLAGIGGAETVSGLLEWLKPSAWMPILALIGICLTMFAKKDKNKNIGTILMGFAILMVGMETMSGAVSGLKESESFQSILIMFNNPILGVLAGTVLTAIVQSSSASVGILQSLTTTGAITYGAAIPIIMGQNIGTCITALISSLNAGKNGKRAALIHLYFNIIGVVVLLGAFSLVDLFLNFAFVDTAIDMWGVALVHTVFKLLSVLIMAPFTKQLEKLAVISVRGSAKETDEYANLLDDRFLDTPEVALERSHQIARQMAKISIFSLQNAIGMLDSYDEKTASEIREIEEKVDSYEDMLGSYLVKLSARSLTTSESHEVTKLLHLIGDFERISDHALNLVESAEEIKAKNITFSAEAKNELASLKSAVLDILSMTENAYIENDIALAMKVEPLEQVVDYLKDHIRLQHILRLQNSKCTIEHGFVLSDILTNLERVSDHCSNIAGCLVEMSAKNALDLHGYLRGIKKSGEDFEQLYKEYMRKYTIQSTEEHA
ncbi:MAG: Na/Pi cotransporter family protein [Clostridia bacterium]|nr:Na/Pi cotransporter family protein [Clostridia bacterium]